MGPRMIPVARHASQLQLWAIVLRKKSSPNLSKRLLKCKVKRREPASWVLVNSQRQAAITEKSVGQLQLDVQSPRQARAGMEEEDSKGGWGGSSTAAGKVQAQQQGDPCLLKGEAQPLADGVDALELDADHCPRILVSSGHWPTSYPNKAKRCLQEHGQVQLSALGTAISAMVTVAEILKARGFAREEGIKTALGVFGDEHRMRQKPKVDIVLVKTVEFEDLMAASQDASLLSDEDAEGRAPSRHSSSSLGGDQQALKDSPASSGEPALPGDGSADGSPELPGDDGRPQLAPKDSPASSGVPALPGDGSEDGSPELPPDSLPSGGSGDLPGGGGR